MTRFPWDDTIDRGPWRNAIRDEFSAVVRSYFEEGMDPDGFVRRYGVSAAALLAHIDIDDHPPETREERERREAWERALDQMQLDELRRRCKSGEAARDLAILDAVIAREKAAEKARESAAMLEWQKTRAREGGVSPEARAARWLSYRSGDSSDAAFRAAVGVVRGFCLGVERGHALMSAEYAPKFHRKFAKGELMSIVRRAMRADKAWGYLLRESG